MGDRVGEMGERVGEEVWGRGRDSGEGIVGKGGWGMEGREKAGKGG